MSEHETVWQVPATLTGLVGHLDHMTSVAVRHRDDASALSQSKARYEGWADALAEVRAWLREHPEPTAQPAVNLVIRPGDKLVVGFPDKLTPAMIDRLRERAATRLPGIEVVVFDGVSHMAVYRAD